MDNTSIKETILNMIKEMYIEQNYNIWLFYLPIVNRDIEYLNEPSGIQNRRNLEVCVLFMRPIINITLFFHGRSLEIKSLSSLKMIFIGDKIYLSLLSLSLY